MGPYWMMGNLLLQEGDLIRITNTSLPKGNFVKLQPVSSDFLDIHNPRAVLENSLRNFATLTVGDSIVINYNQKTYEIEVVECKPAQAISIIEADVNVDFAPPKDYKEEPPMQAAAQASGAFASKVEESSIPEPVEEKSKLFSGGGQRVDGKPIKPPSATPTLGPSEPPVVDEDEEMPWKKRLPNGVKMVKPPYGYGLGHMTGQKGASVPVESKDDLWSGQGQLL